jgi:tetratricopeptide (TPR) repeat protein
MKAGDRLGRFRVEALLGRGGFGEVWRAWDPELSRWAALKLLTNPDDAARFEREAKLAAALSHSSIASVYEAGVDGGRAFIVMQYVDGTTLRKWSGPAPEAARRARDAARAVHFAHEHGVIHRDLKPDNLMLYEALDADPDLVEAAEHLARVEMERSCLDDAVRVAGEGIARDRGYAPLREERANALALKAIRQPGGSPEQIAAYARAVEDFAEAVRLAPRRAGARAGLGMARHNLGNATMRQGGDPTPHYEAALGPLDEAVRLEPDHPRYRLIRATLRLNWANHALRQKEDARPLLRDAIADLDRALEIHPARASTWHTRGGAWFTLGRALTAQGQPAADAYRKAIADFERALKLNPALEPQLRAVLELSRKKAAGP